VAKGGIRRGSGIRVTARVLSELLLLLKAEASLLDFDKRRSTFLFLILLPPIPTSIEGQSSSKLLDLS